MRLRRLFKLAFLSVAALLACGALALWVAVDRAASAPGLKPRIESAASGFLGRPLTIGSLEWRRWPSATLAARDVKLYEDPLEKRLLVEAPAVEARLAILSVFKLAAGITELRFVSPRVSLRRDKAGEWNAVRLADEIAARPDAPSRSWGTLAFNWFAIEGGTATVEDASGPLGSLSPFGIDGSGKLRFGRRHVHFPFDLDVRLEGSAAAVKLEGDLGGHVRLNVDVKNAEPSLARLAWPAAARWRGRWDGTLRYDERPAPRWKLRVRAAPLAISTAAPSLDSLELAGDYAPSSSAAFAAVVRSSTTDLDAKGSLNGGVLALDVKSPKADVDALLAFAAAVGSAGAAAAPRTGAASFPLRATLSADELEYGPADLRDLRAVVSRSTGPYVLESLAFESLGGSITARGSYLPAGGDEALKLSWRATNVDVQALFRLAGSTLAAAGVADSAGSLATGVGDRFLPAMSGAVSVDLRDGWFGGMPGLLKVLTRLNLSTLFAEAEGRHQQRVPFDEAHGALTISKGRVSTRKPLVLQNKTLQMAFLGTYDLPSRTVDGRIVVNFLTVTDEIIGLIPGVRDILLGKEKGLIPVWLSVKGKAADPEINVLQTRTITAPVWNTLRRILKLPKTLLKKIEPAKRPAAP